MYLGPSCTFIMNTFLLHDVTESMCSATFVKLHKCSTMFQIMHYMAYTNVLTSVFFIIVAVLLL